MILHDCVENLLGDRIKVRALKILLLQEEGLTGRSLASLVGASHFKVNQILSHLATQGILRQTQVGRSNLYRLNRDHIAVERLILPAFHFESSLLKELGKEILQRLDPKPISVILYGSVARQEEGSRSDIDLLLIYSDDSPMPGGLTETGDLVSEWVMRTLGNPISVHRSSLSDFRKKATERDPLIRNIIREGRILSGLTISEILDYDRKKS